MYLRMNRFLVRIFNTCKSLFNCVCVCVCVCSPHFVSKSSCLPPTLGGGRGEGVSVLLILSQYAVGLAKLPTENLGN